MAERERTGELYKLAGDRIVFSNWHAVILRFRMEQASLFGLDFS